MDKYIGFDIDSKKVSVCVIESGKKDVYATIGPDIGSMKKFLVSQKKDGVCLALAYEVSGYSGYLHDNLCECVDRIAVVNPCKATWIYRTAKKTDRIDARKQELWQMQLGQLLDEYQFLNEQLEKVTDYLDGYLKSKPAAVLLMSIGGVGPRTAEAVLAYTDGVERFGGSREYSSYFGVVPKHGPSVVRWLLCEAAWKSIRKSASLKHFYERVMNGDIKRKKIAIVAVCRKLLSIMRAMLTTGELFNEELVLRHCGEIDKAA